MGDCDGHLALGYAVLYFFDVRFIHAGKGIGDGVLSGEGEKHFLRYA